VRRQVQREVAAGVEIRPPKYGSERTIHLADGLVAIVKAHLTRLPGKESERWLISLSCGNGPRSDVEPERITGCAGPADSRSHLI
jgi:hypothetical protein